MGHVARQMGDHLNRAVLPGPERNTVQVDECATLHRSSVGAFVWDRQISPFYMRPKPGRAGSMHLLCLRVWVCMVLRVVSGGTRGTLPRESRCFVTPMEPQRSTCPRIITLVRVERHPRKWRGVLPTPRKRRAASGS